MNAFRSKCALYNNRYALAIKNSKNEIAVSCPADGKMNGTEIPRGNGCNLKVRQLDRPR